MFKGRRPNEDMIVVAMHNHEGGKIDDVYNCFGNEDDPLYFLQLRNMFYCGEKLIECTENDAAKEYIVSFVKGCYL